MNVSGNEILFFSILWSFGFRVSISSVQFTRLVVSSSLQPIGCKTPGLPVPHQLLEFTQNHAHWVGDTIQPCYPLSSPSPPALNLSQLQSLFQSQLFPSGGQSTGASRLGITFRIFPSLLNWVSRSVMSDSLWDHGLYVAHQTLLSMEFSRQEYWSG